MTARSAVHPLILELRDLGAEHTAKFESAWQRGGRKSPQDIADVREALIRDFLQTFFPFPFRVAKGVIRDLHDNESASVDAILLSPAHPYTIHQKEKHSLILAEGVEAAIEIKSDPSNSNEIAALVRQAAKTKLLRRLESAAVYGFDHPARKSPDLRAAFELQAMQVPYFAVFMKPARDFMETAKIITAAFDSVPRHSQPDYIILNQCGIIRFQKVDHLCPDWTPGVYLEDWGPDTLAGLLKHLNRVTPGRARFDDGFLDKYIAKLIPVKTGTLRAN